MERRRSPLDWMAVPKQPRRDTETTKEPSTKMAKLVTGVEARAAASAM